MAVEKRPFPTPQGQMPPVHPPQVPPQQMPPIQPQMPMGQPQVPMGQSQAPMSQTQVPANPQRMILKRPFPTLSNNQWAAPAQPPMPNQWVIPTGMPPTPPAQPSVPNQWTSPQVSFSNQWTIPAQPSVPNQWTEQYPVVCQWEFPQAQQIQMIPAWASIGTISQFMKPSVRDLDLPEVIDEPEPAPIVVTQFPEETFQPIDSQITDIVEKNPKTVSVVALVVIVVAIICAVVIAVIMLNRIANNTGFDFGNPDESQSGEISKVTLTNSFTTDDTTSREDDYPVFTFEYPDNWRIKDKSSTPQSEKVSLVDNEGNQLNYVFFAPTEGDPKQAMLKSVKEQGSSKLNFGTSNAYTELANQSYSVLNVIVAKKGDPGNKHHSYAVIPTDSLLMRGHLYSEDNYMPLFLWMNSSGSYGYVGFYWDAPGLNFKLSEKKELEITAILSSFDFVKVVAGTNPSYTYSKGAAEYYGYEYYLLPESDTNYLTDEDLEGTDAIFLYLARNEIYARHGYIFEDERLNDYFSEMPWYEPSIPANEFDWSCLNEYEKANEAFIFQREQAIDSKYIKEPEELQEETQIDPPETIIEPPIESVPETNVPPWENQPE